MFGLEFTHVLYLKKVYMFNHFTKLNLALTEHEYHFKLIHH
jgi:hypothetical protein